MIIMIDSWIQREKRGNYVHELRILHSLFDIHVCTVATTIATVSWQGSAEQCTDIPHHEARNDE